MVQSKLPNTNKSIFSSVYSLIEETGALDMAIGKSDFATPQALVDLAVEYMKSGDHNYAPLEGIAKLRKVISDLVEENYGNRYNPKTEVTVSASIVQAVHTAISAVVRDDDEVIVFEPAFESYVPSIILNGGKPVYMELKAPGFTIDWEELRKMITTKTKMIILNSPHNPTGSVLSEADMMQLQRLTNGTNIIILSDESFESIVFDNQVHQSIARYEKLIDRSFIVSSFGAVYNINGWGIAYCLAPEKLMIEYRKMQQFQLCNVNTPMQYALAEYIPHHHYFDDVSALYQGKRNYFLRLLENSLYKFIPTQGSYFQLIDYSRLSDDSDQIFIDRLARDFGIAVVPVSAFYHEKTKAKLLRVCFAKENDKLEKAASLLLSVPSMIVEDL
ncbi:methionine aminotransferase [Mangrovibacterium diazotrophicum]|uniref:2-keto-4-methylthiobutyrate aminotransferase n=1 Tax=Mangrovibacterium diazotrophicum TaxID=1261403 RepID=A0A419W990_9BACT|nr:methionine aminotransferase [Mangrovibacterium diazotrophicum]RKD92038.1 2-keto-4-methylthiobutyrate aminotransferase [Mangrovibacterium diazotrophicum]